MPLTPIQWEFRALLYRAHLGAQRPPSRPMCTGEALAPDRRCEAGTIVGRVTPPPPSHMSSHGPHALPGGCQAWTKSQEVLRRLWYGSCQPSTPLLPPLTQLSDPGPTACTGLHRAHIFYASTPPDYSHFPPSTLRPLPLSQFFFSMQTQTSSK